MPKKTKKELEKLKKEKEEMDERIAQLKLLVAEKKKKEQSKGVSSNLKEEILKKKKAKAQEKIGFDRRFEMSDSKAFGDANLNYWNDKVDEELTRINVKEEILKKKRLKKLKQDKFDEEVERIRAGIRVFRGEREKERLEKLKNKYPFLRKKTDKRYIEFRDNFVKQYPTEKEVLKGLGNIYFDEVLEYKSIERLTYYQVAGDYKGGFDYEKKKNYPSPYGREREKECR